MKSKKLLLVLAVLFSANTLLHADPVEEGKTIFTSRCAGCHNVNKVLTGPALAGVDTRHSIEWIVNFVHSSQTMVKSGDKAAVALFQQFNRITMPDHSDLSADNIKSIVEYIKSATVATDGRAPFAIPAHQQTRYEPLSLSKDYLLFIGYLFVVALLIGALLIGVNLTALRRNMVNEKSPE